MPAQYYRQARTGQGAASIQRCVCDCRWSRGGTDPWARSCCTRYHKTHTSRHATDSPRNVRDIRARRHLTQSAAAPTPVPSHTLT
ncbi:hypothetical protein XELAEV_18016070mg [Xenopus laevis]|uniref:Uncharacterized protein n=1 Tax=Xenopus laevis TaxID=8355 RepID=A0A974HWQ2_XENLA|nr:hypothetical protein XELAEV_18016070mg [Xenopus laevis]